MQVLTINAGSSSLKLRLLDAADTVLASVDLPAEDGRFDTGAVGAAVGHAGRVDAVGHRVVHGGTVFAAPVRLDSQVEAQLRGFTDLAPLHQPKSLAGIDALTAALPGIPAVACFDTAFHATLPPAAATYAVPAEWRDRHGARRYGFHGLSHGYASRRTVEMLGRSGLRVVTCHLGAGASLAAVRDGISVDTTMGFTPLDGLVMATRCGAIDPGLVLWLIETVGLPAGDVADALEHRAGLQALAGTADMRAVVERAAAGDPAARLALEVYLHSLRAGIAAMAAALGGLDVLVFTGGVGERSAAVRAGAAQGLGFLGVRLDEQINAAAGGGDTDLSVAGAGVRTLVVAAREDLQIAREVRHVLAADARQPADGAAAS
jgi:acetate kinase